LTKQLEDNAHAAEQKAAEQATIAAAARSEVRSRPSTHDMPDLSCLGRWGAKLASRRLAPTHWTAMY
jgi:hypothetical protein